MTQEEKDVIFIDDLKTGYYYQGLVNTYFLDYGFKTTFHPLKIRPNFNVRRGFTDNGDLIINTPSRDIVVEIKSRAIKFTCIADYPFKTVFIESLSRWSKKVKPAAIIVISQKTKAMIVVPVSTEKQWTTKTTGHKRDRIASQRLEADKKLLKTMPEFIDWLKNF